MMMNKERMLILVYANDHTGLNSMSWTWEDWKIGTVIVHRDEKGRFVKGHRHFWPEWVQKISERMIGNQNSKGCKCSDEKKAKISKAEIGKIFSDEHRNNLRLSHLGKHWHLGKKRQPCNEEQKEKLRKRYLGKHWHLEGGKRVWDLEVR
jgi:hypothetical protein